IDQLADGKARIERFEEFGRRMASQSDIEPLAEDVLDQLTEMLDAPVAALYGIRAPQDEVAHLLASRGVPRTALPTTVGVDDGTPGRAIDEGRTIEVEDGSGLASRHEIHVPLFLGDRVIGVLTLARTEDRAFDPIEVLSAEYLSRQVAVGIANAVSLRDARRQAAINHAVLETATDAFVSIDSVGNVSAWNRSAELSFGWSRLEAIGRPLSDTIASTSFCDGLQDFVRTGRSPMMNRTIELTALHCDGREIPVELTISPLMLDGEWTFNAFIRDVSERKRAEQYARAQHAVTRALADSSGLDESRLAAPRALATALGFESGATWIDAGGDEHGVEPRWVEDGDRRGIHLPVVSDERGVLGVIELWTSEARDADQDLLEMLATVASQLAEHTERMRAEAEADRLKDDFFALVSHELRTPLTSIIGYLDLVLEEPERLDPDTARFLEVVARNGRRLHRLVGDLLFVAQVEAGTLAIEKGSVDLTSAVAESVEAARPRAEERGILLRVDAQRVPACSGDADRIGQTLDNLISNAIKFTPEEGSVDVMLRRDGGDAVIEVRDTGIGIPPDDMDRLFERFFRSSLATEQAIQGVGLGLTIAKAIVETHGGRISVESEPGRGTTFTVRLPVGAQPGAEIAMDPARVANPGISR
ncbi:MAG: ATP-binding protein, partial [Thermoleophilaceae bacterium]